MNLLYQVFYLKIMLSFYVLTCISAPLLSKYFFYVHHLGRFTVEIIICRITVRGRILKGLVCSV